jgi:pyridoxamine---pyruvate transaminase
MAHPYHAGPVFTFTPGPAGATPTTLAALGQPIQHHLDPAFRARYAETVELLRRSFGTDPAPVIFPGEAVVGLEAAAASLIRRDDVVLNLVSGIYGRAFGQLARRYAAEVIELTAGYDTAIRPDQVSEAILRRPGISIVAAVHCETPSGTLADLPAIARAITNGALLLVDAVSSFGGEPCDFAGWPADLAVVAPQKCLGGPPGLSLLHVSDRAWQHIAGNGNAPRSGALSIESWRDAHERPFPFTPNVAEINALHACLAQYLSEEPLNVQARHRKAARAFRAGAQALGLTLHAKDHYSNTVTAVTMPDGIDEAQVRAVAREEYQVLFAGGQPDFAGRVLQVGHMGPAAYPLSPVIALTALGGALRRLGATRAALGAAVEAASSASEEE